MFRFLVGLGERGDIYIYVAVVGGLLRGGFLFIKVSVPLEMKVRCLYALHRKIYILGCILMCMKKMTKHQKEIYGSRERMMYSKLMNRRYNRGKASYYNKNV